MTGLRVCIDARLIAGTAGGVEQFIIGLAQGLSRLEDGDETYHFLTYEGADEWILPHLKGPCRVLHGPSRPVEKQWVQTFRNRLPRLHGFWKRIYPVSERWSIRRLWSDGTIEREKMDIMHQTIPYSFLTRVPAIYHPHDLQHINLPQNFTLTQRLMREILFRTFCWRANTVSVASTWVKHNVMENYKLPEEKVQVVPFAPVMAMGDLGPEEIEAIKAKFNFPAAFIFYPAQTWVHKNHVRLLEALKILRDKYGLIIPFISTGRKYEPYFPVIEAKVKELHLEDQVRFLGHVTLEELKYIYTACRCVVIPTLSEAGSFPLGEAFLAGAPATCSNITSLPAQAGDAAIIFDPYNCDEIAESIRTLWTDPELCKELVVRGRERISQFSWDRTANLFRAHYRRIGGRDLTVEDRALLSAKPLL